MSMNNLTLRHNDDQLIESQKAAVHATWIERAIRTFRNRLALMRLLKQEERLLRDIGVRRYDIEAALRSPFWVDPTQRLAEMSKTRQKANHWARTLTQR